MPLRHKTDLVEKWCKLVADHALALQVDSIRLRFDGNRGMIEMKKIASVASHM
jgi:hypothetical protein